jgi:hypothetical protein
MKGLASISRRPARNVGSDARHRHLPLAGKRLHLEVDEAPTLLLGEAANLALGKRDRLQQRVRQGSAAASISARPSAKSGGSQPSRSRE